MALLTNAGLVIGRRNALECSGARSGLALSGHQLHAKWIRRELRSMCNPVSDWPTVTGLSSDNVDLFCDMLEGLCMLILGLLLLLLLL